MASVTSLSPTRYLSVLYRGFDEMAISDNVIFLGLCKDVPEILKILDLFVLPSLYEGLGIANLEAMAAELPVAATRLGGVPEVVIDAETGILVPSRDPAALAHAIVTLLRDKDKAKKMGEAGRKRAISLFGVERMMEKINRLYENLILDKLGLTWDEAQRCWKR